MSQVQVIVMGVGAWTARIREEEGGLLVDIGWIDPPLDKSGLLPDGREVSHVATVRGLGLPALEVIQSWVDGARKALMGSVNSGEMI